MYHILKYFPPRAVQRILEEDFSNDSMGGMVNNDGACPLYIAMVETDAKLSNELVHRAPCMTPTPTVVARFLIKGAYTHKDTAAEYLEFVASRFINAYSCDIENGTFKDKVREVVDVSDS